MSPNPSLYAKRQEDIRYPALVDDRNADVVVIGAGITGLSAALHLARAGRSVVVLDAEQPGWGASGRNGGQVNPGLKTTPARVERDFGPVFGPRLVREAWAAPDLVFALIDHYGIACDAARGGTIRAAQAPSQLSALRDLFEQCRTRGRDVFWLTPEDMRARTGTDRYCGGMIDMGGGQIDPLAYTRGLAHAAVREGATLHGSTRMRGLRRDGALWSARTEQGCIRAPQIVFATNGYADNLWSRLRRSIVPVYSAIIASTPLSDAQRSRIVPGREVVYELGEITTYFRIDATGRLLIGGRSQSRDMTGAGRFPYLIRHAQRLWPDLDDGIWIDGWNGQLAITRDHYPHWHHPASGIFACVGYNGRGVAMATVTGRAIADHLVHDAPPLFPFSRVRPILGHAAWKAGVTARIGLGRLADRIAR